MKFLYYIRVLIVSVEFLFFISGYAMNFIWESNINSFISTLNINKDALNWLITCPAMIVVWMFHNGSSVLFPDGAKTHLLHEWKGYWRLKAHFNIGLFWGISMLTLCFLLWLVNGLENSVGVYFFFIFFSVLCVAAISFYFANIKLREIFVRKS